LGAVLAIVGGSGCAEQAVEGPAPRVAVADAGRSCGAGDLGLGGLQGRVYTVPRTTRAIPPFDQMQPVGTICTDRLAVTERNGYPGFPGVGARYFWFGIDFQGAFAVGETGVYNFRLTSDDGSKVIIDGLEIIDNDGYHPTRTSEAGVLLNAGVHRLEVPFYQGPGPLALTLEVGRPGEPYEVFQVDRALGARAAPTVGQAVAAQGMAPRQDGT
jgi:hypothetical protein